MKKTVLLMMLFLLASFSILSAQGTVTGVVVDSAKADPLIGANVYLVGTALGNVTDTEGHYRITGVPAGTYTLRVAYIGYLTRNFRIRVTDKEELRRNAALVADVATGIVVEVTAQAVGQMAAINQQISAKTIVNVISEEKIQELPDANAAESIGRLPGVSLLRSGGEANKVILRGLEDKFTIITIDGVKIPPTDATSRGVDLSTISQTSLAGIELYKAQTPDKDGDALAGSINLVTKKAPEKPELKLNLRGGYNQLEKSAGQYDFSFRYGERFFNNVLGLQLAGNLENRIRSNERIDVDRGTNQQDNGYKHFVNDFSVEYTDETRKRDGFSVLLDINTPDNGTIKINNVYSRTSRNFFWSMRDYPAHGGGEYSGNPFYDYRDREQDIDTYTSSIRGDNSFIGLKWNWGGSYAQSKSNYPFDYEMLFMEPGGMETVGTEFEDHPEQLIDYAQNNFSNANLYWASDRGQRNHDNEKTAFLDITRPYTLTNAITVEFKFGGKYKIKDRSNFRSETFTPYYLGKWQPYELLPDGTFREKDFTNTFFENWAVNATSGSLIPIDQFFTSSQTRKVYGSYDLTPLIAKNHLRQWYELNRYGVDATKNISEIWVNPLIKYDDYTVTERVTALYLMNTINIGRWATVIAGLRGEKEDNDYLAMFMPKPVSGFPVTANSIEDTTSSAHQTIYLPNVNVALSPLSFMKLRLAAYKALARPDFNMRLDRYIAGRPAEVSGRFQVYVGNPKLKTAQAWNFEVNPTFFSNTIGLISFSAYYKQIDDMYHMLNNFNTTGDSTLQFFGIHWPSQMKTTAYDLTLPYNAVKPTKVWGFEFEHQVNFGFLPGLLKNFVLSYNASIVRSHATLWGSKIDSTWYDPPGPIKGTWKKYYVLTEVSRKLENMPEFFGNVALGYDIGRFSGRISLFYQGEHNVSYSANGRGDVIANAFKRVDLALKQGITKNISLFFNVNNLTDVEEGTSVYDNRYDRKFFNDSEKYGRTADFGLLVDF